MNEKQRNLWENDPYLVPKDEKNLALHREKDKEKFGKIVADIRGRREQTKNAPGAPKP